jgi:hypothetical protein
VRELYRNSTNSNEEPALESLWCIGIPACRDTHDITSEWVICFSYVICAFTYRIVELVFVLSYIDPVFEDQLSIVGPSVATIT